MDYIIIEFIKCRRDECYWIGFMGYIFLFVKVIVGEVCIVNV